MSHANDNLEERINYAPTIEDIYRNLKDHEIILSRGCYYGQCVGLYLVLDVDSKRTKCPACRNGRDLTEKEIVDILESEKYEKDLTEKVWADRKEKNLEMLHEKYIKMRQ